MFRGAIILAVGFSLGYAKAMQEQEATKEFFAGAKDFLVTLNDEAKKSAQAETASEPEIHTNTPEGETAP
jgi:hypothetical protein